MPEQIPPQKDQAGNQQNSRADHIKAVGLILITLISFSLLDTAAKYLTTEKNLPVSQVIWLRFAVQFVLVMFLVPTFAILSLRQLFQTSQLSAQLVRSVLMAATTAFNFLALQHLRLDQTVTIFFLSPLVVALAAGPLLGEWVGWRRLMAIVVGFFGILIVVRPGITEIEPALGYAFGAMAVYVCFILLTRQMAHKDPPLVTLHYSLILGTIAGAPIAFANWSAPQDLMTWVLLLALGVFGGLGHYLFILAHRLAPASTLAPFVYFQIITMTVLGYFVFDDLPDVWTLVGASVVTASGLYLLHRERMVKEKPDPGA